MKSWLKSKAQIPGIQHCVSSQSYLVSDEICSIIYRPALVDIHCIPSVPCAGIIDLKASKNSTQVYNDLFNIYRKVFEVLKEFLYCVERFCIVSSVLGNITYVWPSKWFSTTKLLNNIIEID